MKKTPNLSRRAFCALLGITTTTVCIGKLWTRFAPGEVWTLVPKGPWIPHRGWCDQMPTVRNNSVEGDRGTDAPPYAVDGFVVQGNHRQLVLPGKTIELIPDVEATAWYRKAVPSA